MGIADAVKKHMSCEATPFFSVYVTWWLIPVSKWVITLVINGISGVSPLITRVITHNHDSWVVHHQVPLVV